MSAWLKANGPNICWICGVPIDMLLPPRHPWSWSLDHYHPVSTHPHLRYDYDNAREAHYSCNSARGNRGAHHKAGPTSSRQW